MDVVFKVWLDYKGSDGKKHKTTYARKTVDLPILPRQGMELEDRAWKTWQAVENVVLNLDKPYAYVYLGAIDCDDGQGFEQSVSAHRNNGWEICRA